MELNIVHDVSLPGRAQTNSLIERQVQVVTRGARALLSASGLPLAFWPHACNCFCIARNLQQDANGISSWSLRGKSPFKGINPPFGSYVSYIPPETTVDHKLRPKFGEKTIPGVFLGIELQSGSAWMKGYTVIPLHRFDGIPLNSQAKHLGVLTTFLTVTPDVKLVPGTTAWYPVLDRAVYANKTLSGREEHKQLEAEFSQRIEALYAGDDHADLDTVVRPQPLVEDDELPEDGDITPDGIIIRPTVPPPAPTFVPDTGGSAGSGGRPVQPQGTSQPNVTTRSEELTTELEIRPTLTT